MSVKKEGGKFTPGPWELSKESGPMHATTFTIIGPDGKSVGYFDTYSEKDGTEDANASLIASAPMLYEACKDWMKARADLSCKGAYTPILASLIDRTEQAIASAEGRA